VNAIADQVPASGQVDRSVSCLLAFGHGVQATVRCSRGVRAPANDLIIEGRRGTVTVRHSLEEQVRGTLEVQGAPLRLSGIPAGADMYALQLDAFAGAVREGRDPDASGVDGARVTAVTLAVYEAAATNRTVILEP